MNTISTDAVQQIYNDNSTRYFMMKSFSSENVMASIKYNVWATTPRNEIVLQDAFLSAPNVILFYSVNGSSKFSGYGIMKSRIGECNIPSNIFRCPDGSVFRGKTFSVIWLRQVDFGFQECAHLRNPLNENKVIKIARDGQEIANCVGKILCELIENKFLNTYKMHTISTMSPRRCTIEHPIVDKNSQEIFKESSIVLQRNEIATNDQRLSAALKIFPIDLTNMTYDSYIEIYQKSLTNWKNKDIAKPANLIAESD